MTKLPATCVVSPVGGCGACAWITAADAATQRIAAAERTYAHFTMNPLTRKGFLRFRSKLRYFILSFLCRHILSMHTLVRRSGLQRLQDLRRNEAAIALQLARRS